MGGKRAPNFLYAQSGGVTAVINATAAGVAEEVRRLRARGKAGKMFAARSGVLGVLEEALFDVDAESDSAIAALAHTPGGAFGSCRHKLPPVDGGRKAARVYARLLAVLRAHRIGHIVYNGGNDSADTAAKISAAAQKAGWPLACVGAPKTIDNDLAAGDNSPGFGSAAKFIATSMAETARDVASMARTSTKVFVMEVMGRHAGWLAAAGGLPFGAGEKSPALIVFPELPFSPRAFVAAAKKKVRACGFCVVVVSEGARDSRGNFLSAAESRDSFNHAQLGGAAPVVAALIKKETGFKCHWAVADYLQRAAAHIASKTDAAQARAVGRAAARFAVAGKDGALPVVECTSDSPYRWRIAQGHVRQVANQEKKVPRAFIGKDGFSITAAARRYLSPLIAGETRPPFKNGLPVHANLKLRAVRKKLPSYKI